MCGLFVESLRVYASDRIPGDHLRCLRGERVVSDGWTHHRPREHLDTDRETSISMCGIWRWWRQLRDVRAGVFTLAGVPHSFCHTSCPIVVLTHSSYSLSSLKLD